MEDPIFDVPVHALLRARKKSKTGRAVTLASRRLLREEKESAELLVTPANIDRPRTRGECHEGPRPCPFVSCMYHLYLDVNPKTGAMKLNFPYLEVWELPESCALDLADRGGMTLEQVANLFQLRRERIRQIQDQALAKTRRHPKLAA